MADPHALTYVLHVNGQKRQSADPKMMLWEMFAMTAHISWSFSLWPGDVVLTGTPSGVAALQPGDLLKMTLGDAEPFTAQVPEQWHDPEPPAFAGV